MAQRCFRLKSLCAILVGSLAALLNCQPTPDYRITVHDIPPDAALILVGWKGDSNTVTGNSMAVPVGQLSPDERSNYTIALDLGDISDGSGVLSLATVDQNGCITSVVNTGDVARSSSTSVTMVDVELDPNVNVNVVPQAVIPSPPVMCPANPPFPAYPAPVACPKVPGLDTLPTEPTLIPKRPVVIQSIRQLMGPARVYDSGKISLYGWGFDRATISFGGICDPSKCFENLVTQYPQYESFLLSPITISYPNLNLVSYAQLDLQVTAIENALMVDPTSGFQGGFILCVAVSALSFGVTNPDGNAANFSEVLPAN
jgi:hypothetical protein